MAHGNHLQVLPDPLDSEESRFQKVAECLYRHSSSRVYYALVKRTGKQFRKSLKTADRKLAERRLAEFKSKVGRLRSLRAVKKVLFEEAADEWLQSVKFKLKPSSFRRHQVSVKNLKTHFAGFAIREILPDDCNAWANERFVHSSASTFNKEREVLIQILCAAKRDGLLLDNPAEGVSRRKMDKTKLVIPTRDQFIRLVQTLRSFDIRYQDATDLVELLAYSGMRLGEATELRWEDVDVDRGLFSVTAGERGTKNHEARTVPLFPALRQFLERLKKDFPQTAGKVVRISTAKKAIATTCKTAALPNFTHHSLRHYFCSNAIEAGIDFKVIAAWLGHKDGGVLVAKTYGHLRDTHSFEMAKKMTFSVSLQEQA